MTRVKTILCLCLISSSVACSHKPEDKAKTYYDVRSISYKIYCPDETAKDRHLFANRCVDKNEATDCKEMMQQIYCYKVPTINTGSWDSEIPCPEAVLENHRKECVKAGWHGNKYGLPSLAPASGGYKHE